MASERPTDDYNDADSDAEPIRLNAIDAVGERVDRFVARRLPDVSRSRIQQWLALGAVWCDERVLQAATRLSGRETVLVRPLPREADQAFQPDPVPIRFVYEDDALRVIDKPAGLVVHPAAGNWRGTLLNGLLHHRPTQATLPRAGIVHRLDKDTSGLMVVGATEAACAALVAQLADRSMSRRYLAWVAGADELPALVDEPIGRDPRVRTRMAVVPGGKPARTHVSVLARGHVGPRAVTLVECRLETGRTHQIRVHLAHVGAPLLGDTLYGGPLVGIGRQALHAWRLALRHPIDGRACAWSSRPPDDFDAVAQMAGVSLPDLLEHLERPDRRTS